MEVMKNTIAVNVAPRVITKKSMQLDFEFEMAQKMTRSMYENGMISFDEMNRISELKRIGRSNGQRKDVRSSKLD